MSVLSAFATSDFRVSRMYGGPSRLKVGMPIFRKSENIIVIYCIIIVSDNKNKLGEKTDHIQK